MDLYLPDEFYALSEAPNARRDDGAARHDAEWLGGEAYVGPRVTDDLRHAAEPDPIWRVI
jgi:hypothetical protein